MKYLDVPQSGSMQGVTASRNRNGQYFRSRAIPVQPRTPNQLSVRAAFAAASALWRTITSGQMAGWKSLADQMSRKDSLGQTNTLQPNQAFSSVNINRVRCTLANVVDAPPLSTPAALLTATVTTTGGTLSIAYTPTPMPANTYLFTFASPQMSAGRVFCGDFRLLKVSAAAAASPYNALADYTAKFGVPVVGNQIFFSLVAVSLGFESGPLIVSKVITA